MTTIRMNFGSHAVVSAVYAYAPQDGTALVRLSYSDGGQCLEKVHLSDLEALDERRQFVELGPALRRKANYLLEPTLSARRA